MIGSAFLQILFSLAKKSCIGSIKNKSGPDIVGAAFVFVKKLISFSFLLFWRRRLAGILCS